MSTNNIIVRQLTPTISQMLPLAMRHEFFGRVFSNERGKKWLHEISLKEFLRRSRKPVGQVDVAL